jgi:hypothetical protein
MFVPTLNYTDQAPGGSAKAFARFGSAFQGRMLSRTTGEMLPSIANLKAVSIANRALGEKLVAEFEERQSPDRMSRKFQRLRNEVVAPCDTRWPTAIHESGHAVIGVLGGCRFSLASITPNGESLGRVAFHGDSKPAERLLAVCSGPAAEAELHLQSDYRLNVTDLKLAVEDAIQLAGREHVSDVLSVAKERAKVAVRDNWGLIRLVATALIEKHRVTREQVKQIIASHNKG